MSSEVGDVGMVLRHFQGRDGTYVHLDDLRQFLVEAAARELKSGEEGRASLLVGLVDVLGYEPADLTGGGSVERL